MTARKRKFSELRSLILMVLADGQRTTNQVSIRTGINWRTVEAHLTFLMGKGFVAEVLKSEYVRIFTLTDAGRLQVDSLLQLQHNFLTNKVEQKKAGKRAAANAATRPATMAVKKEEVVEA